MREGRGGDGRGVGEGRWDLCKMVDVVDVVVDVDVPFPLRVLQVQVELLKLLLRELRYRQAA